MSEKTKSWKIGDQEFHPRYDFFFCPSHGLIVPRCFSDEWTTDEGCPCALWNEESCDEPLTPVYLDNLVPAANQVPQVQPDGGEREALRQKLLSRGTAEAICQEVSGLSPGIHEDVEDVRRALARILPPAPTVTAVPDAGCAVVGPPGLTSWSLEPPPDQPSHKETGGE